MGKHKIKKERSFLKELLIGLIKAVLSLALLSVVGGVILYMSDNPMGMVDIASLAVLLLSGALSGYIISRGAQERKLATVLLAALLLSLCFIFIGLIISGGEVSWRAVLNYICYTGVSLLFGLLGKKEKRRARR